MTDGQPHHEHVSQEITDQTAENITRVEELAYDLKISEVMTSDVHTVSPEMTMSQLLELLRFERISGAPVVSEGKLVGIVSLEDLILSLIHHDSDAPIKKYMTSRIITVKSYDPVVEALETFTKAQVGRLPVVDQNGMLVGMITKGDITRGVLRALQKGYQAEEVRRYRASHLFEDIHSDRTSLILRYRIEARDFTHGGQASSYIKRALLRLGANPQIARRCGIAIYEAEMNLIIHTTHGGMIRVQIEPNLIYMKTTDDGPGIADIAQARRAGFTTATEEIRELGFGAGMGLCNIERCVDDMKLTSALGQGTTLEMLIYLQPDESFRESGYFPEEKI
jgi:CBS domain-containing protein/anti-sigma regulatory factor (Ser/Thr protein kinase)